jgi:Asp-tRNA(Asn)/Glu-tRNA(Gln) amidotransferase A subunit family amidase
MRIAVPRRFFYEDLDREVAAAMEEALWAIRKINADALTEIKLEVDTDRTLQAAESYAYHKKWIEESAEFYDRETLRRICTGQNISQPQMQAAREELSRVRREIATLFDDYDVLITPTTPIPAPSLSELKQNPDQLRPREMLLLRNTRPVNVWGLPAISVPCGFTSAGLPMAMQMIGPHGGEARILQLANAYERFADWHNRRPMIWAESAVTPRSERPLREAM